MQSLLGVLDMLGSYETRKVANYNADDIFVDTCSVTDSE